ncbi:MAG: ankyrin repeat domain-containing protein [Burkholderiaceae bacterium]
MFLPAIGLAGSLEDFREAVIKNDAKTVSSLIARGFDANMPYEQANRGLHLAAAENALAVIQVLVKAPKIDINARNAADETALMLALIRGHRPAVDALIAAGAELNKPGWTPLHYAASSGNNALVSLLLEKYAFIDPQSPNGTTPLMMAARHGHISTVKLLLDEGADIFIKNEQGMTARDFAVRHERKDIADGLAFQEEKKRRELASKPRVPVVDLNPANQPTR